MALHFGSKRQTGKRLTTALSFLMIGIGVGSVVAALLTPKTGKQTRKALRRRYEDARDALGGLGEQAGDLIQQGSEWAETAGNKVAPIARKLRSIR